MCKTTTALMSMARAMGAATLLLAVTVSPGAAQQDGFQGSTSLKAVTQGASEEDLACLAEAMYFEARSENIAGKVAVAEVILNRRDSPLFPDTICEVVHQGYNPVSPRLHRCQFSYYCDGKPETVGNKEEYESIRALAWGMLRGGTRPLTAGATYFHATYVKPSWARKMEEVRTVDTHVFYRPTR